MRNDNSISYSRQIASVFISAFLLFGALSVGMKTARAEEVWEIAPGRTSIGFTIKHFVLLSVKGLFKDYHGTVTTPSSNDFTNASVEVAIPVGSISTGNSDRDAHLKTGDFFDANEYPEMVFKSTKVVPTGGNEYELQGLLRIRNISKPVTLKVQHVETKTLKNGSIRSNFVAIGTINRYDFGLRWNELTEAGAVVVDQMVNISIEVSLVRSREPAQKVVKVSQKQSNG